MNEFTHTGNVIYEDGTQRTVVLKSSEKHWIDVDRCRWRLVDGSLAGHALGTKPRLLAHTIRRAGDLPARAYRMTHECRIKGKVGKGEIRELRKTKKFWIDAYGVKFREDGDRVDGVYERLVLASLVEMPVVEGVKKPHLRTQGTHEVI